MTAKFAESHLRDIKQTCTHTPTCFPRKRLSTCRLLRSQSTTRPLLYPMRILSESFGCSCKDSTGPNDFPHLYSSGTLKRGKRRRE